MKSKYFLSIQRKGTLSLFFSYILIIVSVTLGYTITSFYIDKYKNIYNFNNETVLNINNTLNDEAINIDNLSDIISLIELFPAEYKILQYNKWGEYVSVYFSNRKYIVQKDFKNAIVWNETNESIKEELCTEFISAIMSNDGLYIIIKSNSNFEEEENILIKTINSFNIHVNKLDDDDTNLKSQYFIFAKSIQLIIILFLFVYSIYSNISWIREKKAEYIIKRIIGYDKYRQMMDNIIVNGVILLISIIISLFVVIFITFIFSINILLTLYLKNMMISVMIILLVSIIVIYTFSTLYYSKHVIDEMTFSEELI